MITERDTLKLKLLSITLLMTVSSCVSVSAELSSDHIKNLGIDLELALTNSKINVVTKSNQNIISRQTKLQNLIKSNKGNNDNNNLVINHTPIFISIKSDIVEQSLLSFITRKKLHFKKYFTTNTRRTRAGPYLV